MSKRGRNPPAAKLRPESFTPPRHISADFTGSQGVWDIDPLLTRKEVIRLAVALSPSPRKDPQPFGSTLYSLPHPLY